MSGWRAPTDDLTPSGCRDVARILLSTAQRRLFRLSGWVNPAPIIRTLINGSPVDLRYITDMSLKGSHFLRRRETPVQGDACTDYPAASFSLHNGDINGDNDVNILDLGLLADAYNASVDETLYNVNADLNGDGVVDIIDLGILADNYNDAGDE